MFLVPSLLVTGYSIYTVNQSFQLPLVLMLKDPTLYPHDPLAATLPYYVSILWRLISWASRVIPLEPLLFALFVLERLLVLYAAGCLANAFAPHSRLAIIGSMALFALAPAPLIGGGTLVTNYLEQTGLSIPFFMLAMAAFYRSKPIPWAVWLAVGFSMNSMYGAYALSYFGAAFLFDSRYRKHWSVWASSFGLFLILAAPTIFLSVFDMDRGTPDRNLWIAASRLRLPHHLYPMGWPGWEFMVFGLVLLSALAVTRQYGRKQQDLWLFRSSLIWSCAGVVWVGLAFLAARLRSLPLLVLMPARSTDLCFAFMATALVSACSAMVEESAQASALYGGLLFASVLFWRLQIIPLSLIVIAFGLASWIPSRNRVSPRVRSNRFALAIGILVLFAAFRTVHHVGMHLAELMDRRPDPSIEQFSRWAKANTSRDAVFLVDPSDEAWDHFRTLAERPVFTTWKDGGAILWDRPFITEWAKRLNAIGFDVRREPSGFADSVDRLYTLYEGLSDHNVEALRTRYAVRYWITPVSHHSDFPIVFRNRFYKVLVVQQTAARMDRPHAP